MMLVSSYLSFPNYLLTAPNLQVIIVPTRVLLKAAIEILTLPSERAASCLANL